MVLVKRILTTEYYNILWKSILSIKKKQRESTVTNITKHTYTTDNV